MSSWILREAALPRMVYTRPLGTSELGFYWDGEFAGTGDTLQHVLGELRSAEYRALLSNENLTKAWIGLKQRFPLLASTIDSQPDEGGASFVVDAEHLQCIRPGELNIQEVDSAQDVENFNDKLITGPRQLSAQLPTRAWILLRRDSWRHFHVITHIAHVITDGLSNAVILRELFNSICGVTVEHLRGLEDRLSLSVSMESLHPLGKISVARKRWRFAIASVIEARRSEKLLVRRRMSRQDMRLMHEQGGHTLPRSVTPNTVHTPARSRLELFAFPTDVSMCILANCRKSQITFGHAFPVLAQIAQANILHRLRRQNRVNDAEWEYRLSQPMHFEGPRSLRSYLQPEWYSVGGFDAVGVFCSNFTNTLPSMPSHGNSEPDSTLDHTRAMTKERFLYRSRLVKQDMTESGNHPLLFEFSMLFHQRRSLQSKEAAQTWRRLRNLESSPDNARQMTLVKEYPGNGEVIFANGGSSMGNVSQ